MEVLLSPENKKAMNKMYAPLLDLLETDTLITLKYENLELEEELFDEEEPVEKKVTELVFVKSFYPNPVINDLTVELGSNVEATYLVYDASGKVVKEGDLKSIISFSELPSGDYFVHILGDVTDEKESFRVKKE